MVTFLESASSGVQKLFCDALRGGSNFIGLFPETLPTDAIKNTLDGASLNLCNRGESGGGGAGGSWSGGTAEAGFTGGQCENLNYYLRYDINYIDFTGVLRTDQFGNLGGSLQGKITSATVTTGQVAGNATQIIGTITNEAGQTISSEITFSARNPDPQLTINSLQMLPVSGVDTCGNPPPSRPPLIDELEDVIPEITYDDIDGNPVTLPNVPVKFFKPCLNLDGARIPFEIDTPFGKVCGKIGIAGDFPKGVEPSIDIDLCPSQKEDLGLNTPELEDYFDVSSPIGASVSSEFDGVLNEDFDLEQLPIMGVFVNSQYVEKPLSQTVLDQLGTKPNLIIPNIGYVIFQYLIQTGETTYESAYSSEYPIKLSNQFIPCPYPFGAVGVQVRWASNWEGNYRIAKRKSCCKNCSEGSAQDIVDKLDRCRLD